MTREKVNKLILIFTCLFFILVFFLLKLFVSIWISIVTVFLILALIVYSSLFHIGTILGPSGAGLIKANLIAYFRARSKGKSHSEALDWVVKSRYPFSENSRDIVWSIFTNEGIHETPEDEIKSLIFFIFVYEGGAMLPPGLLNKVKKEIDKKYFKFSQKYLGL